MPDKPRYRIGLVCNNPGCPQKIFVAAKGLLPEDPFDNYDDATYFAEIITSDKLREFQITRAHKPHLAELIRTAIERMEKSNLVTCSSCGCVDSIDKHDYRIFDADV